MRVVKSVLAICVSLFATTAAADYRPITEETEFLGLLGTKNLTNRLYGLTLTVTSDGAISGKAVGSPITGTWSWQEGYFCREMDWGGTEIPYNCQLVEIRNGNEMRFTVDRGAGDSASFRLR